MLNTGEQHGNQMTETPVWDRRAWQPTAQKAGRQAGRQAMLRSTLWGTLQPGSWSQEQKLPCETQQQQHPLPSPPPTLAGLRYPTQRAAPSLAHSGTVISLEQDWGIQGNRKSLGWLWEQLPNPESVVPFPEEELSAPKVTGT